MLRFCQQTSSKLFLKSFEKDFCLISIEDQICCKTKMKLIGNVFVSKHVVALFDKEFYGIPFCILIKSKKKSKTNKMSINSIKCVKV